MKVYKKQAMLQLLRREEAIYIGHPTDQKLRYNTKEILKLNKWSLMHNMRGLEAFFQGPIAHSAKTRSGIEERKVDIDEVIIMGTRIVSYSKYKQLVSESNGGNSAIRSVSIILRY
jgi:hypothetical protein